MPELGGSTAQSGILYQNSVAALFLGRLLDASNRPARERVIRVRVEAPTEVDDIVVTYEDSHCAYIQAKEYLRVTGSEWKTLWAHFDAQFRQNEFQRGQDKLVLCIGDGLAIHRQLQELCERAANSPTFKEWHSRLNKKQTELLEKITVNFSQQGLTDEYCQQLLAHTVVEIFSQINIERDRLRDWMPHTNRGQLEIFRNLRDRVGGKARVKGTFEANSLQRSLLAESPELKFDTPIDIDQIRRAVKNASSLLRHHSNTISGTDIHIRRDVVDDIVEWLLAQDDGKKNIAILLDQAGMGKTVVMSEIVGEIEKRQIDIVAIKADQQLSNIQSLADVQSKLDLSYPIEQIVGRLAQLNRVVILVDQIDALSLSLAHDQAALNVVLDLIARLRSTPNIRLLLSCREFDRKTDPRLRNIETEQTFTLSKLSDEQIDQVFAALHIDGNQLTTTTRELLKVPLHLDLLARTIHDSDVSTAQLRGLASLQELYALIWQYVVLAPDVSAPQPIERLKAINIITAFMDSQQRTTAPQSVLHTDTIEDHVVRWLASKGIIIQGINEWSFFHQTFFDYCYARRFIEDGNDIVNTIVHSRQGIFERSKLLQIIAYMRSYDHAQYISALSRLVDHSDLRFHLSDLLLRWFFSVPNPTNEEWQVARQMLNEPIQFPQLLIYMYGQEGWFYLLQSYIPDWLADEERKTQTLDYLGSLIDITQKEVASLLTAYLDRGDEWAINISRVLSRVRNWHTLEAIYLYERTVYKLPVLQRSTWWQLPSVCKVSPETGCRLLHHIFHTMLTQYKQRRAQHEHVSSSTYDFGGIFGSLQQVEHDIEEAVKVISDKKPDYFIELFIPWVENVLDMLPTPAIDKEWFASDPLSHGWYDTPFHIKHAFIHGLISSLTQVARQQPDVFRSTAARLSILPFDTTQTLLAHVYCAVPKLYADDAFSFLLGDQRRLDLGDSAQYDSRQVVRAIYPHLTSDQRTQLENHILSYAPIYKPHGLKALRCRGIEQYRLLTSIPQDLLSPLGDRRLKEWQRKFPEIVISDKPSSLPGGVVGSPIEAERANKMSIRDWLYAMNKYQKGRQHKEFLKGGAEQLSHLLSTLIKDNPTRFYSLFQQLPEQLDAPYITAFASGFASSTAPSEWVFEVFRKYAQLVEDREYSRELSRAIEKRAKGNIPDDIVTRLTTWVHKPMGEDELWWTKGDNHGGPFMSYLNSERGAAFSALMRIFDAGNTEQNSQKWMLIEFAARDKSTALRVGAIQELTYMIKYDRSKAWSLFEKLTTDHEVLLETSYVREFLYWSMYKNFLNLRPYIEQMMNHTDPEVQELGAGLACVASISHKVMESSDALLVANTLAELSITGKPAHRRGAAHIYAYNMIRGSDLTVRSYSAQMLKRLIDDDDENVRNMIDHVYFSVDEKLFYELKSFIDEYALSEQHSLNHEFAKCLWEHGMLDPEWTLAVIDVVLNKTAQPEPWDLGIEELMRFVLRVYTSNLVEERMKEKAMDVFDLLTKNFSGTAHKVLSEWDRR